MQIDPQSIQLMGMILGPLLGAGAGTYFGLKGALNGLKDSARRAESSLGSIERSNMQVLFEMVEHRKESRQYVNDLKQEIKEK